MGKENESTLKIVEANKAESGQLQEPRSEEDILFQQKVSAFLGEKITQLQDKLKKLEAQRSKDKITRDSLDNTRIEISALKELVKRLESGTTTETVVERYVKVFFLEGSTRDPYSCLVLSSTSEVSGSDVFACDHPLAVATRDLRPGQVGSYELQKRGKKEVVKVDIEVAENLSRETASREEAA
jgi:hypothetical protein